MNTSVQLAPYADALFAGDFAWWERYGGTVADYQGERWTVSPRARDAFGLHYVRSIVRRDGRTADGALAAGRNSGHNAVALAGLFGARLVVLLGYDMGPADDGRKHWHPDHPRGMGNGGDFAKWRKQFAQLVADLGRMGTRVVNASRATALTCCERVSLDAALAEGDA